MRSTITLALLFGALALPLDASAHTRLLSPAPRSPADGLKTGPCGNVAPTATPTVLAPGATIMVTWDETIEHPGYYRIAFSPAGDQGYEDNVLLDNIPDEVCATPPCPYQAEVTLPSEPCEGCSLQMIQWMGRQAPYSPYFSCADITLRVGGDTGQGEPDAGVGNPGTPIDPEAEAPGSSIGGGCSVAGADAGSQGSLASLAFLGLAAVILRRRR